MLVYIFNAPNMSMHHYRSHTQIQCVEGSLTNAVDSGAPHFLGVIIKLSKNMTRWHINPVKETMPTIQGIWEKRHCNAHRNSELKELEA